MYLYKKQQLFMKNTILLMFQFIIIGTNLKINNQ